LVSGTYITFFALQVVENVTFILLSVMVTEQKIYKTLAIA